MDLNKLSQQFITIFGNLLDGKSAQYIAIGHISEMKFFYMSGLKDTKFHEFLPTSTHKDLLHDILLLRLIAVTIGEFKPALGMNYQTKDLWTLNALIDYLHE